MKVPILSTVSFLCVLIEDTFTSMIDAFDIYLVIDYRKKGFILM